MNHTLPDWVEERTPDECQRHFDEIEIMLVLAENGFKPDTYKRVIQRMNDLNLTKEEAINKIKESKK